MDTFKGLLTAGVMAFGFGCNTPAKVMERDLANAAKISQGSRCGLPTLSDEVIETMSRCVEGSPMCIISESRPGVVEMIGDYGSGGGCEKDVHVHHGEKGYALYCGEPFLVGVSDENLDIMLERVGRYDMVGRVGWFPPEGTCAKTGEPVTYQLARVIPKAPELPKARDRADLQECSKTHAICVALEGEEVRGFLPHGCGSEVTVYEEKQSAVGVCRSFMEESGPDQIASRERQVAAFKKACALIDSNPDTKWMCSTRLQAPHLDDEYNPDNIHHRVDKCAATTALLCITDKNGKIIEKVGKYSEGQRCLDKPLTGRVRAVRADGRLGKVIGTESLCMNATDISNEDRAAVCEAVYDDMYYLDKSEPYKCPPKERPGL